MFEKKVVKKFLPGILIHRSLTVLIIIPLLLQHIIQLKESNTTNSKIINSNDDENDQNKTENGQNKNENVQNENRTEDDEDIVDSVKTVNKNNESISSNSDNSINDSSLHYSISLPDIREAVEHFSIDWDKYRDVNQCSCGKPLEILSRKVASFIIL